MRFVEKWFPRAMVALTAAICIGGIAYAQLATESTYHVASSQHVCVLNVATAVPATALASRSRIAIQNQGPAVIYCTVDGDTPVAGTAGFEIGVDATWAENLAANLSVKCIAAAIQASGNCCAVTEYRATPAL